MKRIGFLLFVLFLFVSAFHVKGVNIENFPQKIIQPDGRVVHCFLSGDEYYNWLHDADNYTIIQDPVTGYYCYAICENGVLIASKYIVGVDNPSIAGLKPGNQISTNQIFKIRSEIFQSSAEEPDLRIKSSPTEKVRTLNNLVIYVRFSDQEEFEPKQAVYSSYFNSSETGANSMYNYFREAFYQKLNIVSTFYPLNDGNQIISYKDPHTRKFYIPWTAQNDLGYSVTDGGAMRAYRERTLVVNAINAIKGQIPSNLDLDSDNDGKVDNVCLILQGILEGRILYPQMWQLYNFFNVRIGNKRVNKFNIQIEKHLDVMQTGDLCHEMFHTLGAWDLYRHDSTRFEPVGRWDLMGLTNNPPQSMCADSKWRFGRWIEDIPEITCSGHYSLNPITSSENNCYKLNFADKKEYFMLEFRQKSGTFESSLPGTGLIIYRINKMACCGNFNSPKDWMYVYRPKDTFIDYAVAKDAYFDVSVGRSAFTNSSDPKCFLSDGSDGNIFIKNIQVDGNTVSFDVRFCDASDVTYSETDRLPPVTNAVNLIQTKGAVIVKSTDSVILEAGNEILLNPGFEVQPGGQFETNLNCCGNLVIIQGKRD